MTLHYNYGPLHDQSWAKANIHKFHTSLQYSVNQCAICKEAWPLQWSASASSSYTRARCVRDKQAPKKFSVENSMVPGQVPEQLQNLTQVEEMLIACALPIMRVYIKTRWTERIFRALYKPSSKHYRDCLCFAQIPQGHFCDCS